MRPIIVLLSLVACLAPGQSYAQALPDYKCEIRQVQALRGDGSLGATSWSKLNSEQVLGKEFVVDRESGKVLGALSNSSDNGHPEVKDVGSTKQAFKVITVYGPFVDIWLLRVEEHIEGAQKPFLFVQGSDVYSGVCTHYRG